jgi:hypothetical protein
MLALATAECKSTTVATQPAMVPAPELRRPTRARAPPLPGWGSGGHWFTSVSGTQTFPWLPIVFPQHVSSAHT